MHALCRGHGGRCQIAEGLQHGQRRRVGKAAGLQRIQRQQAPGHAAQLQHTAHAVVHMQLGNRLAFVGDQTVVGVGQGAVWLKAHGLTGGQQLGKARVLGQTKAAAQRIGHQAINRHGVQPFALKFEQGDGIGGQQIAQRSQKAAQAFAFAQVLGQIGNQRADGIEDMGCCHNDINWCQ